jgi:tocopherol cyclase
MRTFIYRTLNPALYHGYGQKPPFFEGWYYKMISQDYQSRFAIIPGVILGEDQHAFIQILNGQTGDSKYIRFPFSAFWASDKHFELRIGENFFSQESISLSITDQDFSIKGSVSFHGGNPWPVSFFSPGIMGWYAWMPAMECYHGVLSFDHTLSGSLEIGEKHIEFTDGRGYIEKDWGQSFPDAWVWMQTNHFSQPRISLTASIAIIPWLGSAFRGFIVGLWQDGKLYRFATYTGAKTNHLEIQDNHVNWHITDKTYLLKLRAQRTDGGTLLGPTKSEMGTRLTETLSAIVDVQLIERKSGQTIFQDQGRFAGMEVHGNLTRLTNL